MQSRKDKSNLSTYDAFCLKHVLRQKESEISRLKNTETWKIGSSIVNTLKFLLTLATKIRNIILLKLLKASPQLNYPVLLSKFNLKSISLDIPIPLTTCNPSICRFGENYFVTVRAHNCKFTEDGDSYFISGTDLYNENWLLLLNKKLEILKRQKISSSANLCDIDDLVPNRNGLEDLRLYTHRNFLRILGTSANTLTSFNIMATGQLDDAHLTEITYLLSPTDNVREKNWMPIESGTNTAIYSLYPLTMVSLEDGSTIQQYFNSDLRLKGYSGGSQVIPYDNGYLAVVHRKFRKNYKFFYLHKFISWNKNWEILHTSNDFFIEKPGIEFCAGLASTDDGFFITYGINDEEAKIAHISTDQLKFLFNDTF